MKKDTNKNVDKVTRIYVKELVEEGYQETLDTEFANSGYKLDKIVELPTKFLDGGTIVRADYVKTEN